ncbi:hypothetical protein ILYODFUR_034085 [Ilyodon furcidens]|uniref:Phosphoprotein n=1 Tax=Ilyodon furcidens TaxID=33524 RepID=A0ABV0UXG4_9TELE
MSVRKRRYILSDSEHSDVDTVRRMPKETPKSRVSKQDSHRRRITTPGAGAIDSSTTNTGLTPDEIWTSICKVLDAVSNLGVKIEEISQKIDALQEKVLTLPEGAQNMQFKTKR